MTLRSTDLARSAIEHSKVMKPWSKMNMGLGVLACFHERDNKKRNRRKRTDHQTLRAGSRSIKLAVSSSLRAAASRAGAALSNLAALLSGSPKAVLSHEKARLVSTWAEPRSAGRELVISRTSKPFFSSAVANARASVVLPAAGGPKSSMIIGRTLHVVMRAIRPAERAADT